MRLEELDLRELLHLDPAGGIIRFAGQRAVLLDVVALGLLRKQLVEAIGWTAARSLLLRFGYAHGWRTAESLREFPWESEADWRRAGGRLHTLQGLVRVEPLNPPPEPEPFAHALLRDSYEAEQHLLHLGRSEEPVCWTLAGFASGYMSFVNGREVLVREERCAAQGHAACRLIGRHREEWERLEPGSRLGAPFEQPSLPAALEAVAEELKRAERRLRMRRRELARDAAGEDAPGGLVARSEGMRHAIEVARRAARADLTVLVTGESGVGKERIARLVHEDSARAAGPFVALNCGAIPEPLVEAELFGHVRGAFTGAAQDRAGLFEAASGGTLFLDEVGELPLHVQPKLLRAVESREIRRLGESRSRAVDVRLVAATHRDLGREVAAGRFRRDLLYRLRVVEVAIPPLRDRPEDVLPLARRALEAGARRQGRKPPGFTPAAADQMVRYRWPGNVRELENAVERALALTDERIDLADLPEEIRSALPEAPSAVPRSLERMEKDYVLAVLRRNGGNRARTAAQLGIGQATLYRKLKAWRARGPAAKGR